MVGVVVGWLDWVGSEERKKYEEEKLVYGVIGHVVGNELMMRAHEFSFPSPQRVQVESIHFIDIVCQQANLNGARYKFTIYN